MTISKKQIIISSALIIIFILSRVAGWFVESLNCMFGCTASYSSPWPWVFNIAIPYAILAALLLLGIFAYKKK